MRIQLELPNEVAAELAGPGDAVMKTLEEHLDCEVFLRGNVLTLDGDDDAVAMARTVVREMTDLVRQGHEIAPGTIEAIAGALDRHESPSRILEDVVWRHRGLKVAPKTVNQKRYVDAIRRAHDHGRRRPGRHRQVVPRRGDGRRRAVAARGEPHRPHAPGRRGGRAARLPPRRHRREGRPVPAPAVRRPLRHARAGEGEPAPGARRDRGGAAGIHARSRAAGRPRGAHPDRVPDHRLAEGRRSGHRLGRSSDAGARGLPAGSPRGLPGPGTGRIDHALPAPSTSGSSRPRTTGSTAARGGSSRRRT